MIDVALIQTATITPKQEGLDFVSAPVSETQLYADGCRFAILYICRPNETHMAKIATPDRVKRLHDAGVAVLLNYEASGGEGALGAARGLSDGQWARGFAEQFGYPKGLPLMCSSFDRDVRPYLTTASSYGHAFDDGLGGEYQMGVYGGTPIISALRDRNVIGWKAMATSWSPFGYLPVIHIEQAGRRYNNAADHNTCVTAFDAWLPHDIPDPNPVPDPHPVITHSGVQIMDEFLFDRPFRPFDSRNGAGPTQGRREIRVQAEDLVPAAKSVTMHVSAENVTQAGWLTFWSGDGDAPQEAALLKYSPGGLNQSLVKVPVIQVNGENRVVVFSLESVDLVFTVSAMGL